MADDSKNVDKEIILSCDNLTKTYTSGLIRTKTVIGAKDASRIADIRQLDKCNISGGLWFSAF